MCLATILAICFSITYWGSEYCPSATHYDDVIMTMLASQITSLTVVYSIVYSGVNQRKHQSSASLAFVREIHRGPVNFPHKWPVTRKMFPFDDVIMWSNLKDMGKNRSMSNHNKAQQSTNHIHNYRYVLLLCIDFDCVNKYTMKSQVSIHVFNKLDYNTVGVFVSFCYWVLNEL